MKSILFTALSAMLLLAACKKELNTGIETKDSMMEETAGLVATSWPSAQDPGLPFYARVEPAPPHFYADQQFAVIIFYRQTSMIPADFNLLQMFDVPGAFFAASNVSGTSLWHGTPGEGAPKIVLLEASAPVEVWFVPVQPIMALLSGNNPVLTISAVNAISGIIKGYATQLQEVNHPHALPAFLGGGGHPNPKLNITARGVLESGGNFQLHLSAKETAGGWARTTKIKFQ